MPVAARVIQLHSRPRFGIEITPAKTRPAPANLNEALAMSVEVTSLPLTVDLGGDALGHCLSLVVGEDPRLGKGKAQGEGNADDVADGVDSREPGLQCVPVYGHPAALPYHASLTHYRGRYVGRYVDQEVEVSLGPVAELFAFQARRAVTSHPNSSRHSRRGWWPQVKMGVSRRVVAPGLR